MGKIYRSMQGRQVDMDKLMRENEMMPAIGNVKVNARGDELGPGGQIIKKREDIMSEYYEKNPKAVSDSPRPVPQKAPLDVAEEVSEPVVSSKKNKATNES